MTFSVQEFFKFYIREFHRGALILFRSRWLHDFVLFIVAKSNAPA